jgi:hypothetical protein
MRWVGLILYPLLQITFDSLIGVIKFKVQMILPIDGYRFYEGRKVEINVVWLLKIGTHP